MLICAAAAADSAAECDRLLDCLPTAIQNLTLLCSAQLSHNLIGLRVQVQQMSPSSCPSALIAAFCRHPWLPLAAGQHCPSQLR